MYKLLNTSYFDKAKYFDNSVGNYVVYFHDYYNKFVVGKILKNKDFTKRLYKNNSDIFCELEKNDICNYITYKRRVWIGNDTDIMLKTCKRELLTIRKDKIKEVNNKLKHALDYVKEK